MDVLKLMREPDHIARVVLPVALDGEIAVRTESLADGIHSLHDAPVIFLSQAAPIAVVPGLHITGIGPGRYAIALKLERGPSPLLRLRRLRLRAPLRHVVHIPDNLQS